MGGLVVPLAGSSRLRKLRHAEEETVLSGTVYEARLREQHARLHPNTAWAALPAGRVAEAEGPAALLASAAPLSRADGAGGDALGLPLPAGELAAVRVRDGNAAEPAASVIRSVAFHPSAPILLAAGLDKTLRLFACDGARNPKLQGVHFGDMPIHTAAFSGDGAACVATGRRRFFYVYHLEAGRAERVAGIVGCEDRSLEAFVASPPGRPGPPLLAFLQDGGRVPLVSLASRACIGTLQMPGTVRSAAFAPDGFTLLTGGGDGLVCVWDLRTQRCVERLADAGALSIAALAAAPGGRLYATGGAGGIVNLYSRATHVRVGEEAVVGGLVAPRPPLRPQPLKTLGQLTSTSDTLAFSADGQMLAFGSRLERDGLRVLHVPSRTVFANWPSSKTPLHYVHAVAFSPGGGYLAAGNARGRVLLYRLKHYENY